MWAADGFVVVQPTFPLTNREAPGAQANVGDVVNQPSNGGERGTSDILYIASAAS